MKDLIARIVLERFDPEGRCTNYTLYAFGICSDEKLRDGLDLITALKEAGWKYQPIIDYFDEKRRASRRKTVTLKEFSSDHPKGDFYIITRGHAMALRDGKLYDLTRRGKDRRVVQTAFKLWR